jgi:hypothetical protein
LKILWALEGGIGNVCEVIPAYLNVREKYGEDAIDVRYLSKYDTDSIHKTCFFPARVEPITNTIISEYIRRYNSGEGKTYDYIIVGWHVSQPDGSYDREYEDSMREMDSEVNRNLRIAKRLGADTNMLKECSIDISHIPDVDVVLHNGGLNKGSWVFKKYPHFEELAKQIKDMGYTVWSVGSEEEVIPGTKTVPCGIKNLPLTVNLIANAKFYIGTDTGTAHIAGLLERPGIVIYTMTDPNKNYDREFHKSLKIVQSDADCSPCQKGYHFMPTGKECKYPAECQDIPVGYILGVFEAKMETIKSKTDS